MKRLFFSALGVLLMATNIQAQKLTLEDIWKKGTYRQESVYGLRSMNDGEHYTTLDRGEKGMEVNKYSYATGEKIETIISESILREWASSEDASFQGYTFSENENMMLLWFDQEHIYRHSTVESYWVLDLKNKSARILKKDGKQRHATISPDGNKIAFIEGNNLYVQDYKTQAITALTTDGEWNKIINGFADWVYEEEFSFDKAFFWAPDGSRIAYYKTDESEVKEFNMQKFTGLYPEDYRYKYPKAGEDNSKVTIHVYDIASGKTHSPNLGEYEYIPRIKWTETSEFLAVMKMPR
ncbi:MAG: DPP IV N-terminal domain-containing protein, partial [Flavobacteriales bacterium]